MKKLFPFIFAFLMMPASLLAREAPGPIPGSVIIQLKKQVSYLSFLRSLSAFSRSEPLQLSPGRTLSANANIHLFKFDPGLDGQRILQDLQQLPEVLAAQLDYELEERLTPDDTFFRDQWGSQRIELPEAWDITTGGTTARGDTIVVAITDSGYNPNHFELIPNIWHNNGEIPDDGIDNDNNGYIDDDQGWNFKEMKNRHPADTHGHRVAGIIGARGNNNFGTSGINWEVKLMLFTSTKISDIISSYDYMIDQRSRYNQSGGTEGAFVVATNLSLGLSRTFCRDQPVWGAMYDKLGAVGILAGVAAANENFDVEEFGDMPLTCSSDYILAVTNTTAQDIKYEASAFGITSVDMGAPGEGTVTIDLYEETSRFSGNSAAAPHITGAIALLYSLPCDYLAADAISQPAKTALTVRQALLDGVDPLSSLQHKTATGGRLNVFRSMQVLSEGCSASIGELALFKLYPNPTTGPVTLEMQTPDFGDYELIVTNALGQIVYRETFSPLRLDPKKKTIELTNLAAGVYTVSLANGKKWVSEHLVVR